jgi:anti-sigma factor RsiW
MDCAAYQELAAAHADGQLDPSERAAADEHVAGCAHCAEARGVQTAVSTTLRQRRLIQPAPVQLRDDIARALAGAAAAQVRLASTRRRRTGMLLVGAIAAGLALFFLPRQLTRPDLLTVLAQDARAADAGTIAFGLRSGDVEQLGAFYHARLDISEPLPDLRRADFHTVGGTVATLGTTATTLTVYRGPGGTVVCRRFRVGQLPLPAGGREIEGARYFEVDGITVRIQRFGDTVCCMASTMPTDALARLFMMPRAHHPPPFGAGAQSGPVAAGET